MKEARYFYVPASLTAGELPEEEATHAIRVLRLREGDEIFLIDGMGTFHRAEVTLVSSKHCAYRVMESIPQQRLWRGSIHLAMAPTKMMERVEWMAEKATEIGFDELSFLQCRFSERKVVKTDRIRRIVVAAAKQSRKAWMPTIHEMTPFEDFIAAPRQGAKFIAHCYEEIDRSDLFGQLQSLSVSDPVPVTILVGPEGDFSVDEVRMAISHGYVPVSLGECRLRTETAALAAVMMAQLALRY